MPAHIKQFSKGFTLVELLVVVTIIAILTIIGITVFTSVQKNARDARRKADINAIANAMEANYDKTANPGVYDSLKTSFFSSNKVPQDPINNITSRICNSQLCKYCYDESDSATTVNVCVTTTGNSPVYPKFIDENGYATTSLVTGGNGGPQGGVGYPYWMICANLEGTVAYYCRQNIQ